MNNWTDFYLRVSQSVSARVFAHEETTRLLLGAVAIGGHVLLEGPPGIAKTLLAKTFAQALDLRFNRIQFTPDLMPSDVTGVNMLDPNTRSFRFVPGPIHADIVLADEINRTPPKTQSALLEAMEERQVTIDGERHALSPNFFVIATQNPIEHEGTFPLPEAQLDRFLFRIKLGYPPTNLESAMVQSLSSTAFRANDGSAAAPIAKSADAILTLRQAIRSVTLSPTVTDYLMQIVTATRDHPQVLLGISPRGALNLALAAKFEAACEERDYVVPDDIKKCATNVLAHRILLRPDAFDSTTGSEAIVTQILDRVPPPARVLS